MNNKKSTFTSLILVFAAFGVIFLMSSCNQSSTKSGENAKTGANGAKAVQSGELNVTVDPAHQNSVGSSASPKPNATIGGNGKISSPMILDKNLSSGPVNPNAKIITDIANRPSAGQGVPGVNMPPEQKRAFTLIDSGTKKSEDGDQDAAIADFTESLNQFKMPFAYMKRGFAELIKQDYTSAQNDFNESIKMNPMFERAFFGRGVCKFERKDYDGAQQDLEKFVARDKTTPIAYNYLAGCRFLKQDYKNALDYYDMVVKLDPKFNDVYTNRGMMKHYLNDLSGAIEDYNKALQIDTKNATAYNNRGGAKLNMGDSKGALEDFDQAIALKSDYSDAFDNRGKAKLNLNDPMGACEDFRTAYSLGLEASKAMIDKYCR